jgi:hypothetical protein
MVVKAEFGDGTLLNWESSYQQIPGMAVVGSYPTYLKISGWAFRGQIGWSGSSWSFVAPPACVTGRDPIYLPDLVFSEDESHHVVAVLTFTGRYSMCRGLLFKEAGNGHDYERIGSHDWSLHHIHDYKSCMLNMNGNKRATFGAIQLEWMEIRVL